MRTLLLFVLFAALGVGELAFAPNGTPWNLPDDPGAPDLGGRWIDPTEFNTDFYFPVVRHMTGAYLGVGTFRTLSLLGAGHFAQGILMDFDKGSAGFNRSNLGFIRASATRTEYLSALFRVPIQPSELKELDDADTDRKRAALEKKWRNRPEGPKPADKILSSFSFHDLLEWRKSYRSKAQWEATILGSDTAFGRVREMALQDKIQIVHGDLTGTVSLAATASELKARGIPVSVVDISNSWVYFGQGPGDTAPEAFRRFRQNLAALPLAPEALLLMTRSMSHLGDATAEGRERDGWSYYAMDLASFIPLLTESLSSPASGDFSVELEKAIAKKHYVDSPSGARVYLRDTLPGCQGKYAGLR